MRISNIYSLMNIVCLCSVVLQVLRPPALWPSLDLPRVFPPPGCRHGGEGVLTRHNVGSMADDAAHLCTRKVQPLPCSASSPQPALSLAGPREQLNQITSYIDGSMVYGSTPEVAHMLRTRTGGRLNKTVVLGLGGRHLLPLVECEHTEGFCFKAGQ